MRRWDPAARTLRRHLEQTINSKLWHEYDRTRRRRHIPLDTTSVDDSQDETALDVEMSLQREDPRTRPDGLFEQREVRAKIFHALRLRAGTDRALLDLLDSYETGVHREGEVTTHLALNARSFENLVRRFHTARGHLPRELRENLRDMLTRDGGAPIATVARRNGGLIEIVVDEWASNDSNDGASACDTSNDGGDGDVSTDDDCAA